MKIFQIKKEENILSIFLILILFMFKKTFQDSVRPYIIYQTGKTFPRPILLDTEDVIGFSGETLMLSRYNSNGEVVYKGKVIKYSNSSDFEYGENACIRQFSYASSDTKKEKPRFVVASGTGNLKLVLFSEDGIITETTFSTQGDFYINIISYKIDIYILPDYTLLVSYVNHKDGANTVHVRKFTYDEVNKKFVMNNFDITRSTDNNYISCVQTKNLIIVCQYVKIDCREYGFSFNEDGSNQKDFIVFDPPTNWDNCGFDKVIALRDNYVVFTFLNGHSFKFNISEVNSNGDVTKKTINYDPNQDDTKTGQILYKTCEVDTNRIDSAKFDDNTFVLSCVGTSTSGYHNLACVDYETFDDSTNTLTSKFIHTNDRIVNYPYVSKFSGNFLSIFYHLNNDNVFEIIGYPICNDYESQTIYINANTENFNFSDHIGTGSGEDTSQILQLYFPEVIPEGTLYKIDLTTKATTKVTANSVFSQTDYFFYQSSYKTGNITIKYAGKRGDKIGTYCWLIFHVTNCHEGCKSCNKIGDDINMKCLGCNKTGGYFANESSYDLELTQEEEINCYSNETTHEGYYLDGDIFKFCWQTCKYCINSGNEYVHNCTECIENFLPVINSDEDKVFNCVEKDSDVDGYYSNGTHFLKCYISCLTCSAAGTESNNNCKTCNYTHGYYQFDDADENIELKGQCSKTDYPGYHYLYDPDPSSTTDEPIWKACYETCSKCTEEGSATQNNCEKCKKNYYKIDEDTKGTCTNNQPTHYYLDNSTVIYVDEEEEEIQIYKTCYESCNNCTNAKNEISMNCALGDKCYNNTYHKLYDVDTECHNETTVPDNYYYNSSIDKYKRCHVGCQKCYGDSDNDDNTLCIEKKCSDGYAYVDDKKTQCYKNTTDLIGYYLTQDDEGKQFYKKCEEGCLTCVGGTRNDCTSCLNNEKYYQNYTDKDKDKFRCYYHPDDDSQSGDDTKQDEAPSHYVYTEEIEKTDGTTEIKKYVKLCYQTCKTCVEGGIINDQNCISCIENYYFIINTDNCVNEPEEYYLDEEEDNEPIYKPCYSKCLICKEDGNDSHNNCTKCKSNYESYPDETYKDKGYINCIEDCGENKYYNVKMECDECEEHYEYIKYNLFCINCKDTNQYHILDQEECISEEDIPENYYKTDDNYGTIKECDIVCKKCIKCINNCGTRELNCTTCADDYPILYNGYCYNKCPDGKYLLFEIDCVEECPYYLYANSESQECEECADGKYKNKNKNECTESIPDGNVQIKVIITEEEEEIEKEYKVYDECYETCLHCNKPSDDITNQECTLCKNKTNGYENDLYIRVDTTNCKTNCDDTNDNYYVKDYTNTKCINCKKNSESNDATIKTKIYHFINENECINDPGNEYYLIDEDTGTIGHCYERCLTCIKAEEYEEIIEGEETKNVIKTQNCDSCKSEYVQYGKECLDECPEKMVNVSKICKNCKTDYTPPKYNYQNECVNSKPEGTDMVDEDYNYVESCGEKCATCKIVDTIRNCYTCKSPYYKQYKSEKEDTHYVDCEENCGKYLVKDNINRECINCKENTDVYKYYYNGECVDINDGNHDNYYESEEEEEEPYGVIKKCDINCATCFGGAYTETDTSTNIESEIENCKSCDGDLYLLEKNCVTNCPYYLAPNITEHKCVNCKDKNLWNYNHKCIPQDEIPVPYVIINETYNLVSNCEPPCLTCKRLDNGKIECTSCLAPYFFNNDNNAEEKCVLHCGQYLVEDTNLNECINCKENSPNPKNKYYYNGMCVDLEDPDFKNYYESEDEDKNPYGVIEKCYKLCSTCIGKENLSSNPVEMKCTSCINGYYLELSPSTNCTVDCGLKLGIDDSNNNDWKCVNCKETLTDYGKEQYKVIYSDSNVQDNHCVNSVYPGYYISDEDYNIIEPCDESCLNCEGSADHCTECAEGYISNPYKTYQCVKPCTTKYWYVDDNNDYKCSDECSYITDSKRDKIGGNQCVEKCTADLCIYCKTNEAFYVLNNSCVIKCPNDYITDSSNVCIKIEEDESQCTTRVDNARHSVYLANLANSSDEWIDVYYYTYGRTSEKKVDIYKTHNTTFQIFKDDNCQYESSMANQISYVNTTNCKKILMEKYGLKSNEILFVKYDIFRTIMVNQVHYNAYNSITGEILDTSICGEENIYYPFDMDSKAAKIAKYYYDLIGIDVFNVDDPFFNDICFQFYDNYKNDVILAHRRYYIFQNISLCEKGCNYQGINFHTSILSCSCPTQLPSLSEVDNLTETQGAGDWKRRLKEGNIECIKCYNLVFSTKYAPKNAGFFIILLLCLFQILALIPFIMKRFKQIYAFLNQFTYEAKDQDSINPNPNPPKKKGHIVFQKLNFNDKNELYNEDTMKKEDEDDDEDEDEDENNRKKSISKNSMSDKYSSNVSQSQSSENYTEEEYEKKSNDLRHTFHSTKNNFTHNEDQHSSEREYPIISKNKISGSINSNTSHKLKMLNSNPVHLTKEKFFENANSTQTLQRKEYIEPEDADVESFDEDEIDYLQLSDAVDYDKRSFLRFLWRVCKRKIIFLKPFTDISIFEPFDIRICAFLFYITWYFVFTCLFFRDKYIGAMFLTQKKLKYNYTLKHVFGRSIYVGLICSIISILCDYCFSVKMKFVRLIRYEKNQDFFLNKIKVIMNHYKCRIVLFFIIDFILMLFCWYYVSSFCAVYIGTQNDMIIAAILAILFGVIFQMIFSFIITLLRHLGLKNKFNICYKISQILL